MGELNLKRELRLQRGVNDLLLSKEARSGGVVFVGFLNGVEEFASTDRGEVMKSLLAATQPASAQ